LSFIKITQENIETFSLTLHPSRSFTSSSTVGVTGDVHLVPRPSRSVKDVAFITSSAGWGRTAFDLEICLQDFKTRFASDRSAGSTRTDYSGYFVSPSGKAGYLDLVHNTTQSIKNTVAKNINCFSPPFAYAATATPGYAYDLSVDSPFRTTKDLVVNNLLPAYSNKPGSYTFDFTNYNSLNFFTASSISTGAALVYPNNTGSYVLDDKFTLSFFINPRYTTDYPGGTFKAGTILHVSSSFAVSLVTGSGVDRSGYPNTYRLMLQLSHSADISPDLVSLSTANNARAYPQDLVFLSPDFQINRGTWNHAAIRWSSTKNSRVGNISINGYATNYTVPSASIKSLSATPSGELFIGNRYDGNSDTYKFFNTNASSYVGIAKLDAGTSDPSVYSFNSPLNAELHDIKIYRRYLSDQEVENERYGRQVSKSNLAFFLPPTFVNQAPTMMRRLQSDLVANQISDFSFGPFNKYISGRVAGRVINIQNYLLDLANGCYPRQIALEPVFNYSDNGSKNANDYIMQGTIPNRVNHTILPCDDGNFNPSFGAMLTSSLWSTDRFGNSDPTIVNLGSVFRLSDIIGGVDTRSPASLSDVENSIRASTASGISPVNYKSATNSSSSKVVVPSMTKDLSSDEVEIINVSNLFYGDRIFPGSLTITDSSVTGSDGKMSFTLKDNGLGSLYRADAGTNCATWSSVGNVFYDEGIILIKSPNLYLFGKNGFKIDFKGQRNMHVLTINVPCDQGMINSSSNPNYLPISASLDYNDTDPRFVYITGIQLHDDNLNVIMRANLAQPLKKRNSDEFLFRLKQDF